MFESDHDDVPAYELQGRYAPSTVWVTLDHRDPWGHKPTEFRVVRRDGGAGRQPYVNRRQHVRVDCDWPVTAVGIELTGRETTFEATVRNISTGGLYLEAKISANLAVDKPLRIMLPDPVGVVEAIVRRFLEHSKDGANTTSWGVEFTNLTMTQRAHISRLVFTAARNTAESGGT
jgi:c-di-GMP-binding flagellar brake protein YcgR